MSTISLSSSSRQSDFITHLGYAECLCCTAHQVASIKGLEDALGVEVPHSVHRLREILVLGEWISSHALSYFFLTMPDLVGAPGGVFELMSSHPEISTEAFALRKAGLVRQGSLAQLRCLHRDGLPVPVGATDGAGMMRAARTVALRTVGEVGQTQPQVAPSLPLARLGVEGPRRQR